MCPDMDPLQPPTPPGGALADDELDGLVRALGRPADSALDPVSLELAFDRLGARIRERSGRPPPALPAPHAVILVFATALLVAAAALGAMRTTHTGFFPAKAGTENDTSEYLRTDAPDFPPLVRKLVRDTPFPPGDSALARVPAYVRSLQPGADGIPVTVQAAGIRGHFAEYALCAWRGYWLQEHAAGHAAAAAAAARSLEQVATARAEAADGPSAETVLAVFYRANCLSLPKPWAR